MEFIYTPWKNKLIEDLKTAKNEVILVSPYIKSTIAREIYSALSGKSIKVRTISRFSKSEFISGSSDLEAHFILSGLSKESENKYELRLLSSVHAKIFIIDNDVAYLGSSNLTFSGLLRNFEGTIRITDASKIALLKDQMLFTWNRLKRIEKIDFNKMIPRLSEEKLIGRLDEKDHFYDINKRIDAVEGNLFLERVSDRIVDKGLWGKIPNVTAPSIEVLIEESIENSAKDDLVTIPILNHISEENKEISEEEKLLASVRLKITTHIQIIHRFLNLLKNHYSVSIEGKESIFGSVLRTPSANNFWRENVMPKNAFGILDPEIIYCLDTKKFEAIGHAVLEFCAVNVACKIGIVKEYGHSIANLFVTKACTSETSALLWNDNLLGPILTGLSLELSDDLKVRQRLYAKALDRLFAVLYLEEGLIKTLEIAEQFFNPADIIGIDIIALADLEDAKTTLQNIAQANFQSVPKYSEGIFSGNEHQGTWMVEVSLQKFCAIGEAGTLKDARTTAAIRVLELIGEDKKLFNMLSEYRDSVYDRAYKPSDPLFPSANLSEKLEDIVSCSYQTRFGTRVKPSLGFAAIIDPETKKLMKFSYSNSTMAWFGSHLIQIFVREDNVLINRPFGPNVWDKFAALLEIEELRTEFGISNEEYSKIQIAQSIATALYFSNEFSKVKEFFEKILKKLKNDIVKLEVWQRDV